MKVVDIADEIYKELGSSTDTSVPAIVFWLIKNVGGLNNFISKLYIIDDVAVEISPELGETEKYIFKKMYYVHFYEVKLRASMVSIFSEEISEISDQGSMIKYSRSNKNEISKHFAAIKKQEYEELQSLVAAYKSSKVTPLQVAGDDTIEVTFSTNISLNRLN